MKYIGLTESLSRLGIEFPLAAQVADHESHRLLTASTGSDGHDAAETPEQELLHLISSSKIDLIGGVALLIKAQWERWQNLGAASVHYSDETYGESLWEFLDQPGFTPDVDALYQCFRNEGGMLQSSGYNEQTFMLLCKEMASARLFWGEVNGPELEAFRRREAKNLRIFSDTTEAQIQTFQRKKLFWLEVYDQLGEKIMVLEQVKLRREEVNRRFMVEFGDAHLALEEQLLRLEEAGELLDYCRANPGASRDDIENTIANRADARKDQLRRLQHAVFMAPYLEKEPGGNSLDRHDFLNYRAKVKRRLLEIRMILHPDRLAQHPRYGELNPDQQERLAELWHRIQEVSQDETGYADEQVGGMFRSLSLLDVTLIEAKAILAQPGIDTDIQLIPQGDTMEEQMAWLNAAIDWIDGQTASVTAEVCALERDDMFRKRQALLGCSPERKAQVRQEMVALAKEYEQQVSELEAELNRLLTEVEHDPVD